MAMTTRLLLAFALVVLTCTTTGCNVWRARQAARAARVAEQQARNEARRATEEASQARKEQKQDARALGGTAPMNIAPLVEGNNRFALELYDHLRSGKGNLFFSPSSISTALGMAYAGASGRTEAEMAKTLHFEMPRDQLQDAIAALQSSWKTSDKKKGFRLNAANRLWGQDGYDFLPAFLDLTRTKFGAELARLDFARKPDEARQTINQWVAAQTEDKIKDLIPSPQLLADARLVLTNAVYFKGDWSAPFDKKRTKDEDFHVSGTDKVKAPLMHRQDRFRYASRDGMQVLDLSYGDGSLSMVVLLPQKVDGLAELEGKLSVANLQQWVSDLQSQQVIVYLPRFKTTSQFEMNDTLKSMGMVSAFDPSTADFSGMTGKKDLFLSAVIHKAFVDVNEEGTEAAAATGVVAAPTAAPEVEPKKPPVFRADHPFVFLIRDNRNSSILFLGRVTDPT
jgi:serpin B